MTGFVDFLSVPDVRGGILAAMAMSVVRGRGRVRVRVRVRVEGNTFSF